MTQQNHEKHHPRFGAGERVTHLGEGHGGRVQSVSMGPNGFRYLVKWDVGPTTIHDEADLQPREAPVHYP